MITISQLSRDVTATLIAREMRMTKLRSSLLGAAAVLTLMAAPPARAAEAELPPPVMTPEPAASPDEPFLKKVSPEKAALYLDTIAVNWSAQRQCGTCHTNYAYMMARPSLGLASDPAVEARVRSFFEERVTLRSSRPALPHSLILAAMLTINDAEHGKGLSPATRDALDRVWELQGGDGTWKYPNIFYSPPLGDSWYGSAMVALAVGLAPDNYAATPQAKKGMEKLARFFAENPAPTLHHKTILLWASLKTPGLMTKAEQSATFAELSALQHKDGGWSLRALGTWNRRDGSPNDPNAPSDGYATGLVTYVMAKAGYTRADKRVDGGVKWLLTHQRESGRWFTASINTDDKGHLISNIGTGYAIMALRATGALDVKTADAAR